jgi:thymidylate kinase
MSWSCHIETARAFFAFLEEKSLPYALLGDASSVYVDSRENDYDMVVRHEDCVASFEWVSEFCVRVHGRLVQCLQHEVTARHYIIAVPDDVGTTYFQIDICSDYLRNGRTLLTADELLSGAVCNPAGIRVPKPSKAFIYYFLKKVDKPFPFAGYPYLAGIYREDPIGVQRELGRFFPSIEVTATVKAFEEDDEAELHRRKSALKKCLPGRLRFWGTMIWLEMPRIFRRVLQPTGLMVAFLGPDGSGKSTVIRHIVEQTAPMFRRTRLFHLRPLFRRGAPGGAPVSNPHAKSPRGYIASLIKIIFWWMEYGAGYVRNVYPAKVRSTLVVMDRYYDDLLIDPVRYRWPENFLRIPEWGWRWVPRPDLTFVLLGSPDVLWARKKEVPLEVLKEQVGKYREWGERTGAHIIRADRAVDEVVRDVEFHILEYMRGRLSGRQNRTEIHSRGGIRASQ